MVSFDSCTATLAILGKGDGGVEVGVPVVGVAVSVKERGASCSIAKKFRPSVRSPLGTAAFKLGSLSATSASESDSVSPESPIRSSLELDELSVTLYLVMQETKENDI